MPARRKAGYRRATTTESDVKNDVTCPLRPASRIGTSLRRSVDNEAAPSRCRCSVAAQRSARPLQAGVDNARTERRPRPLPRLSAWGSQRQRCLSTSHPSWSSRRPGDTCAATTPSAPSCSTPHARRAETPTGCPSWPPCGSRAVPSPKRAPFPLRPKTPPATSASRHQGVGSGGSYRDDDPAPTPGSSNASTPAGTSNDHATVTGVGFADRVVRSMVSPTTCGSWERSTLLGLGFRRPKRDGSARGSVERAAWTTDAELVARMGVVAIATASSVNLEVFRE